MSDLFKHLKDNKKELIDQKKMALKECDSIPYHVSILDSEGEVIKAEDLEGSNPTVLLVKAVINTTNIIDSHMDCHIPKIWNRSLKEKKDFYLLQEHQMKFDKIITSNVKASVETLTWKELKQKFEGNTEALIFNCEIDNKRNPFMFEQYLKGYVKNHSVGMRYIQLILCLNSEEKYYAEEKEAWDKYYPQVANKEVADEKGFFWAVTEAKIVEGSAVPIGSNTATPTMSTTPKNINEPVIDISLTPDPTPVTPTKKQLTHLFI